MGRRRLAIATLVAEHAAVLAVATMVILGALVIAAVSFIAFLLPQPVATKLFLSSVVFTLSLPAYTIFIAQSIGSLRRRPLLDGTVRVPREAMPDLYALADDVARALGTPPPTRIALASTFGVAVMAQRAGYDLVLGMPLMDILEADELRARIAMAVAREYAGDPIEARAFRAMSSFAEYFAVPHANFGFAQAVAAVCLRWLPIEIAGARQKVGREKATTLFGDAVATSLARPEVYDRYIDEAIWGPLLMRHALNEKPPDAISQLRAALHAPMALEEWTRLASALETPALADLKPADAYRERWNPASSLVPPEVDREVTSRFDESWRTAIAPHWREVSQTARSDAAELADLEQRVATLTEAEGWHRIELIESRRSPGDALPLLRDWLARHPADARASFHTGRLALDLREPDGLDLIEQAIKADEKYEAVGSQLIGNELMRRGDATAAGRAFERAEAATKRINEALGARLRRLDASTMRPHGLEPHQLAALRGRLGKHPYVVAAFASRLEVAEFPTIPCIVIVVRFGWWWSEWHGDEKKAALASIGGVDLPMQVRAVDLGLRNRAFAREPASAVYRGASTPRSVTLAKWGRRAQRALIAAGVLLVLDTAMRNRDCFPGCWEDIRAVLVLGPLILGTNALMLTGSPDTSKLRGVAFATSAFFAGMFAFSYLIPLVPVAFAGFMRVPLDRRASTWAVGLSFPAFVFGWFLTRV